MSKFNSEPIDIIVPWVNPNDTIWQNNFVYWKEKETGNKDACRYRDFGFIKFVLRSIEKNCSWCRYIFLVLSEPSQIPEWLNINNPRLKIIYHKDYIPKEFLPTFNSNIIELFYSKIEALSENFILCNDDTFFIKNMEEDFYFNNNIPVVNLQKNFINKNWHFITKNTLNYSNKLLNTNLNYIFDTGHLPVSYNKTLQLFILNKALNDIQQIFKHSKFRTITDISHFLFYDIQCKMNHIDNKKINRGDFYILGDKNNIKLNGPLLCLNDSENTKISDINNAIVLLNRIFIKKSSFEI